MSITPVIHVYYTCLSALSLCRVRVYVDGFYVWHIMHGAMCVSMRTSYALYLNEHATR